jgi:hypothetical protein
METFYTFIQMERELYMSENAKHDVIRKLKHIFASGFFFTQLPVLVQYHSLASFTTFPLHSNRKYMNLHTYVLLFFVYVL